MAQKSKVSEQEVNPDPRVATPLIPPGVQDHSFHAQAIFAINEKIGNLNTGLVNATERLNRLEGKVDQIQIDLTALKTTTGHIEELIKSGLTTLRAIGAGLGVFILSILGMWLKHKMNW